MVVFNRSALDGVAASRSILAPSLDPLRNDLECLGDVVGDESCCVAPATQRLKRIFDVGCACLAMLLVAPVVLIAAVLIKMESKGPVFFRQERIGINRRRGDRRAGAMTAGEYQGNERRDQADRRREINAGRPFNIYKLRTMRQDAENDGPALARKGDARITRIGSFLRRSRCDELPQFINVLRGEMSIIGPRPERSFYINKVKHDIPEFPLRLRVKPGITGLAQVENGYTETVEMMADKLYYDLKYISEFSLLQEVIILFKTVYVVVSGKGAC